MTELETLRPVVNDRARSYIASSKAARTIGAYQSDLRDLEAWSIDHGRVLWPASPETIADYIADLADRGYRPSTIARRLSSVSQAHQLGGWESPTHASLVRMTMAGIRRRLGAAWRQAHPLSVPELRLMVEALPDDVRGLRDRALLLVGFAGALRRSELVALTMKDVRVEREGLRIIIRRSKTDQDGAVGREIGVTRGHRALTDPVLALEDWLTAAAITDGPIFRPVDRAMRIGGDPLSDRGVARILKRAATRAGLAEETVSGHSLRAGFATAAAAGGAPERIIMATTGHKSVAMVRRYIRSGSVFVDSASPYLEGL